MPDQTFYFKEPLNVYQTSIKLCLLGVYANPSPLRGPYSRFLGAKIASKGIANLVCVLYGKSESIFYERDALPCDA